MKARHSLTLGLFTLLCWAQLVHSADSLESLSANDARIRDRYEQVLKRNPFQERAFSQVFESYLGLEGVDTWINKLKPELEAPDTSLSAGILLGQIYARQFRSTEAIKTLESVSQGEQNPAEYDRLLGTLYYREGQNERGIELLTQALTKLDDVEDRAQVSRMLGNLFLRDGDTDKAIEVWKQVAAQTPKDLFAQLELADIYQENRLWSEAIEVYQQIVTLSDRDPYRKCRALRSIGNCQLQAEQFPEAIATYESALELVAPGNWLFEDLKLRLVQVYEDMGDLTGLVAYIQARLEQNPTDLEFRDLLAETYLRMNRLPEAETEYHAILERNPRHAITFEKLIGLYERMERPEQVTATYEKLIELFPADPDYLRRLGETYWRAGDIDQAKATWERRLNEDPTANQLAGLASWFEIYEFPDDAIAYYQKALATKPNREWSLRLAEHLFNKGENDQAIATWESILQNETATAAHHAEVAAILDAHQLIEQSEAKWRNAIEKEPNNLDYSLQLARNLMRQEKFEEALQPFTYLTQQTDNPYFQERGETGRLDVYARLELLAEKQKEWEEELAANPESLEVISRLAKLYQRAGQREAALYLLERRTELAPDNTEFRRALIQDYKNNRYIDEAIAALQELARQDRVRARVYQQELLDIYLSLDLADEAIATAEKIIEMAPADAEARLDLAQVYSLYQRPEDALQQYRYALRLEPNEPDYHRQYGSALMQEQRYGEAQASFQRMLDTAKEDGTRLSAVGYLTQIHGYQNSLDELTSTFSRRIRNTPKKLAAYEELARIYHDSGELTKALQTLEDALQNVDDKSPALQALIRAAYELQDFTKVLSFYEQLIDQKGKPSPFEYERLGSIYAQMGDLSKARETWSLMLDGDHPDPKSYDRLASIMQRENFVNEAIEYKKQAVDLDEYDYRRRWEYAQMLASTERPAEAIEQLQKILELGDRQLEENPDEAKEKSVRRRTRGPQIRNSFQSPFVYIYGIQQMGGGYYGGPPRGTFQEMRPNVIGFMASLAQNSIGEDALLEQFTEITEAQPKNTQAKRDLMLVYQSFGRVDDALKIATEVMELAPDDADLLQQTAVYYASQQNHAEAIPLLEKLVETQPKFRTQALQGLIPLYFQIQEKEKAISLMNQLLEENPSDFTTIQVVGSMMQRQGQLDEAIAIFERAQEHADPRYREYINQSLAQIHVQKGNRDQAKEHFSSMLVDQPNNATSTPLRRTRVQLYTPTLNASTNPIRYGGAAIRNLPNTLIGQIDYRKAEAIRQLNLLAEEGEDPLAPLRKSAEEMTTAATHREKDRAWDSAKLLIANHLAESEFDEAAALLDQLKESAKDRLEWLNLSLYLAKNQDDCDQMVALYQDAEERFPAHTRKLVSAKASVAILCEKFEEAATHIRQMIQQRVPPKEVIPIIQPLIQADEAQLAKQLLEEYLSGMSRNGEALALLATIYSQEDNHKKAIALAREAWDRSLHGQSNQNYYYYNGYFPGRSAGPTDNLLNNLHQYYVKAGKSDELIEEFETRLAKQPGSVRLHENLATLHKLNEDRDKAIEVYAALVKQRPHLVQAKQQLARLYTEKGDFSTATEIFEQLLKTNPNIYQQISWELRNLYQRTGRGKDIAAIEDDLAKKATNPNQIMQLAQQFQNSGELEKAAELYKKAIKMSPMTTYYNRQLADVYVEMGKHDEAIKLYKDWINSPIARAQGRADVYLISHLTGIFASTGRLEELKEMNEGFLKKNANDPIAQALNTQIAIFEKRFDEAIDELVATASSGQDPNAISSLLEIGELTGRIKEVVEKIDNTALMSNFFDKRRMAGIYLSTGDHEKGVKMFKDFVEERSRYGGPSYYWVQEAINTFGTYGLWEDAEELVRKNLLQNMQSNDRRELNRIIAEIYVNQGQLKSVIDEIVARETYRSSDAELITEIANRYRQANEPDLRKAFLTKVVARDTKNQQLVTELARLHLESDPPKAHELAERLLAEKPSDEGNRSLFADVLIANQKSDEAIAMLNEWSAENESENRFRTLASYQEKVNDLAGARSSLVKSLAIADSSKKKSAELNLADFDARHGNPTRAKQLRLEAFTSNPETNTFNQYLDFLRNHGYYAEARGFYLQNKDAGFTDRWRNQRLSEVFLDEGDFETPIELAWNFLQYSEKYNRPHYYRETETLFKHRGKHPLFLERIESLIESAETKSPDLIALLAESYASAGIKDKADAFHARLKELNPYNQDYALKRAAWLNKSGRTEEAIALIEDLPPAPSLQTEVQNQLNLIRYHAGNDDWERAESTIDALLSWSRDADTEGQIGDVFFAEGDYDRALTHYENSRSGYRRNTYSLASQLVNLGKCYAMKNQPEKAIDAFMAAKTGRNSRYLMASLQHWLITMERYETALLYFAKSHGDGPPPTNELPSIALCHFKTKGLEPAVDVFRRNWEQGSENLQEATQNHFVGFVRSHQLTNSLDFSSEDEFLKACRPALTVRAIQEAKTAEELSHLSDLVNPMAENSEVKLALGLAHQRWKQPELATTFLRPALDTKNPSQRIRVIEALAKLGEESPELGQALTTAVNEQPSLLFRNNRHLELFFAMAPSASIDQWLASRLENLPYPSHKIYYQFLAANARNQEETANELLNQLVADPSLPLGHLNYLAETCQKSGRPEIAANLLRRIADGGFNTSSKWTALEELTQLHLKNQNFPGVVATLGELYPMWRLRRGQEAFQHVYDELSEDALPTFEAALSDIVAATPNHDRNVFLSAFANELREKFELEDTKFPAGLTDSFAAQAQVYTDLIEDWEIAGPYTGVRTSGNLDELIRLVHPPESQPNEVNWIKVTPQDSFGFIAFDTILDLPEHDANNATAYARTTLVSPDDRSTTLGLGSDDWAVVYLNGEKIHTYSAPRSAFPDQDLIHLPLKAGDNELLVKVGNISDSWRFCARIVENGTGVEIK